VKELWKQAGALRESLQNGPIETATLQQQVLKFKEQFERVQETMANWGDGDRSALAKAGAVRPRATVTEEGFAVDLPLLGLQLGGPRVAVVEEGPQVLQRIRLHPNSHGSRRRLQRELTAVKLALQYLLEDAEVEAAPEPPAPGNLTSGPVPHPPEADEAKLGQPVKIQPMGAK
ncbi:MAG: hypothetical protein JSS02_28680, partial [Planctomycetes bacterium]|nr:hypothetical protein [Planctomycetota bacterium]